MDIYWSMAKSRTGKSRPVHEKNSASDDIISDKNMSDKTISTGKTDTDQKGAADEFDVSDPENLVADAKILSDLRNFYDSKISGLNKEILRLKDENFVLVNTSLRQAEKNSDLQNIINTKLKKTQPAPDQPQLISYSDFEKLDIRVGTVINASIFPKAKKPSYQLDIDFGDFGVKKSSAQITTLYSPQDLINKQIVAVVNFPPKRIANFVSEVLVLGVVLDKDIVLLQPDRPVPNGKKIA